VFGAVGVIVILAVVGIGWYFQEQAANQEQERVTREQALERIRAMANKLPGAQNAEPEYPPTDRKREKQPRPLQVIQACQNGFGKVSAAVASWKMGPLKCDGQVITTDWSRSTNTMAAPLPGGVIDPSTSHASLNISLAKLQPRGPEGLLNPTEITRRYMAEN